MTLCFGTFARILNCCKQGLPQERFVPRIVWIVDQRNRCLGSKSKEDVYDSEQEAIPDDRLDNIEGNKSVVSRLLSCTQGLELRDKHLPSVEVASERFKAKVIPHINKDKIVKAVLAVLYIISQDETIGAKRKETFREYVGMYKDELLRQMKFYVPDFFARVLLYTICIDNEEGQPCVKKITDSFIEKTVATINDWAELKWDITTQTVEVIRLKEKYLWKEIHRLSELRLSLMNEYEDANYTALSQLDIDERVLFPSKYRHMELRNPTKKAMIRNKMMQYKELLHELTDCLTTKQKSALDPIVGWSIFPDKRTRNICNQLIACVDELNELFLLGIATDYLYAGEDEEEHQ